MQSITNISNTTCQSSDSGVELGETNSKSVYTNVLVLINESCLVLNSEQNKQI